MKPRRQARSTNAHARKGLADAGGADSGFRLSIDVPAPPKYAVVGGCCILAGEILEFDPLSGNLRDITMREICRQQFQIGEVPVEKIWINPKSRDDIPAVLKGFSTSGVTKRCKPGCSHCWTSIFCRKRTVRLGVREWTCGRSWYWGC